MINMKFKHQINLSNDPKFIKVPKQVMNYIKLKQNNKKKFKFRIKFINELKLQ